MKELLRIFWNGTKQLTRGLLVTLIILVGGVLILAGPMTLAELYGAIFLLLYILHLLFFTLILGGDI